MQHTVIPEPISHYSEKFSTTETPFLRELNQKTQQEIPGANMLSGHVQGLFLQLVSLLVRPRSILEIGTYTGYSATCLARGLKKGGTLHTVDIDDSLQSVRDEFWEKEGLQGIIKQHIGSGDKVIPELKEDFDLVFIDADKKNYGLYFDLVIDKIPSGGWILADNVLFHGEIVLPENQQSESAHAIHHFNTKIAEDNRVEQVVLTIRDGLMLIRKK